MGPPNWLHSGVSKHVGDNGALGSDYRIFHAKMSEGSLSITTELSVVKDSRLECSPRTNGNIVEVPGPFQSQVRQQLMSKSSSHEEHFLISCPFW